MKPGKALRLVLSRWDMSPYRLAKASGVGQSTIGKLIRGDYESASWDVIERLANGFGKLDIVAKAAFLGVLTLPDSACPDQKAPYVSFVDDIEKPENVARVLAVLEKLGLLNQEACQELVRTGLIIEQQQSELPLEQQIGIRMQMMRLEESDQDA